MTDIQEILREFTHLKQTTEERIAGMSDRLSRVQTENADLRQIVEHQRNSIGALQSELYRSMTTLEDKVKFTIDVLVKAK